MQSTVDEAEVEQFSRLADTWWDTAGPFKPLHAITPLRVQYIRDQLVRHCGLPTESLTPLKGLRLADIGCGGGLITEPMARLGASVTGIDASEPNIRAAQAHASQSGLIIDYRATTVETLVETHEGSYDAVLALEIVEHVADVGFFVRSCLRLLKPGGILVLSTLNRTMKSYALAIIGAEYVLRWLPRGTHDWNKFLRPSELMAAVERGGGTLVEMTGMTLHPLTFRWQLTPGDLSVNYLMVAEKMA